MKEFLEKCIFSNKYALENISRSCYGLSVGVIVAILVKTDAFNMLTISISITTSLLAFLIGLLIDNIRKELK